MPRGKTRPERINAALRRTQALGLRRSGLSYYAIADEMQDDYPGYDATKAYQDVSNRLYRINAMGEELSDDLRVLECERLDAMLHALWPKVEEANIHAVECCIRIAERRAKLLGLDAPTRTDVTSNGNTLVIEYVNDWRNTITVSTSRPDDRKTAGETAEHFECGEKVAQVHTGDDNRG